MKKVKFTSHQLNTDLKAALVKKIEEPFDLTYPVPVQLPVTTSLPHQYYYQSYDKEPELVTFGLST